MLVKSDKKNRNVNLDTKLDFIKRLDNGQSKASIGMALGLNESTVQQSLSKFKDHIKQGKVASAALSIQCTVNRSLILAEMENLLITWLEDRNQKQISIGTSNIIVKALTLFSSILKIFMNHGKKLRLVQ